MQGCAAGPSLDPPRHRQAEPPLPLWRCAGYFLTKIFHPNISKTGEICVNTLKKDWKHDLGIGHVLQARTMLLLRLARHADRPCGWRTPDDDDAVLRRSGGALPADQPLP